MTSLSRFKEKIRFFQKCFVFFKVGRCPPLSELTSAVPDHTNATDGSVVVLTCAAGYEFPSVSFDSLVVLCSHLTWNVTRSDSCQRKSHFIGIFHAARSVTLQTALRNLKTLGNLLSNAVLSCLKYNNIILILAVCCLFCFTAKHCGELMTSHGELNSSDTRYPAVVRISCDVGYHVAGNRESDVTCGDDATWMLDDGTAVDTRSDVCTRKLLYSTCNPTY